MMASCSHLEGKALSIICSRFLRELLRSMAQCGRCEQLCRTYCDVVLQQCSMRCIGCRILRSALSGTCIGNTSTPPLSYYHLMLTECVPPRGSARWHLETAVRRIWCWQAFTGELFV